MGRRVHGGGGEMHRLAEVRSHSSQDDAWIILGDPSTGLKVYDVSSFVGQHPGAPGILGDVAGKYVENEFRDIGHSSSAPELAHTFYIGGLEDSEELAETQQLAPLSTLEKVKYA